MAGTGRPELPEGDGSGAFLKSFGRQMKLLRERAGLRQIELGQQLGYGEDLIASVEQGRRIPRPELIDKVDELLDAGGLLCAMKDEVARARYPSFFRDAARIEAEAVELNAYDTHVIKGLLQTEEYARAVFAMWRPLLDDEIVEQRVAARMARQQIFARKPAPLMSFVIEEAVLHRTIGGKTVLRGQLEQLLLIGQKRTVEIQIMPTARDEHAGLAGPFTLMEGRGQQRIAYTEVQGDSRLHTDQRKVRELESTYGIIRAQALTPRESLAQIEKLLGET
ncbi:MAG TPA: transcriptional regulator [Streptomyces sp.]|nr:transcriptional regulator [Streptomyces sp.]